MFVIPRTRLGQSINHVKSVIGSVDRGVRMARKVYHAVREHVPEGKMKSLADKASKGVSDYESIRAKVRDAAPLL